MKVKVIGEKKKVRQAALKAKTSEVGQNGYSSTHDEQT